MDFMSGLASAVGMIEVAKIIAFDRRDSKEDKPLFSPSAIASDMLSGRPPAPTPTDAKRREYTIQFNPSELSIDASREIKDVTDTQAGPGAPITEGTQTTSKNSYDPPTITLSTRLVFDEVNLSDAFAQENITSPASASAVKSVVSNVMAASGKEWTVQPIVEGFIGALRNDKTRLIRFEWAEFCFTGWLSHLSCEYVMFSPSGKPIRAFVNLRLKCDLDSDRTGWLADYKNMFGPDAEKMLPGVSGALPNLGSLGF
jgi:hypothetical protein